MRLEDYLKKILDTFPGHWSRGQNDQVPEDHFSDCLNVEYDPGEVRTRSGLSTSITVGYGGGNGKVRQFVNFFNPTAGVITLILDDANHLYTFSSRTGDDATTPLITVAGATDFTAIQLFGRIYICFSSQYSGLNGINLKVYIPGVNVVDDVIRDAAGTAPVGSAFTAVTGAGGLVNTGYYKIAFSYITSTGFVTKPGPIVSGTFTPTTYFAPLGLVASDSLTSDTTQPADDSTITIGGVVYTFKTALDAAGTIPNQILIGATVTDTYANLSNAIMSQGTPGTDYGFGTQNPGIVSTSVGETLFVYANKPGTSGNSITVDASISPNSHSTWATATFTGGTSGTKIDLSGLPDSANQIQILITKANENEYFFLPSAFGGVVPAHTTTATLDFDDTTDLVKSADYLFDIRETIPTGVGIGIYSGRLVIWGIFGDGSVLLVSNTGDPETFGAIDGIVIVSKDDGFTLTDCVELRSLFYMHKTLGIHAVRDNGDIPANWLVFPVDKTVNTPPHGISEFFTLSGIRISRDFYSMVDRSGILVYNGTTIKPPLTYKINDIWKRINFTYYYKVILAIDEQNHKLYCALPIDAATENNTLLVGDYNECPGNYPEYSKIKWSQWQLKPGGSLKSPTAIGLMAIVPDTVPTLKMGSIDGGGKIWKLDPTVTDDDGTAIESFIETALLFWKDGSIHTFNATQLRITGSGNLLITISGEDNILPTSLFDIGATRNLTFYGSGLDDLTLGGTFSGGVNADFQIKITTAAGTDKFKYSNDGGQTFSAEISITGAAQSIGDGLTITFGVTTGHTLGDIWVFEALNNPLVLESSPGREFVTRFFFQNEKAKVKFRLTAGKFVLSTATVYGKPVYTMRPA